MRFEARYWIPLLGYLEATRHNTPSLNFLENTVLYFALGFLIRRFNVPLLIPLSLVLFSLSAVAEWVLFSRFKPRRLGWDKLDAQSYVWCVWQSFCFFFVGMLV